MIGDTGYYHNNTFYYLFLLPFPSDALWLTLTSKCFSEHSVLDLLCLRGRPNFVFQPIPIKVGTHIILPSFLLRNSTRLRIYRSQREGWMTEEGSHGEEPFRAKNCLDTGEILQSSQK